MDNTALFQAACERRDYALLQDAVAHMTKRDAVDYLHEMFPHQARAWFVRNLTYLMQLDPLGLSRILTFSNPTADKAIRNVMNGVTA